MRVIIIPHREINISNKLVYVNPNKTLYHYKKIIYYLNKTYQLIIMPSLNNKMYNNNSKKINIHNTNK